MSVRPRNFTGRDFGQGSEPENPTPAVSDPLASFSERVLVTAMLDAVGGWSDWCHRRIDRYEPTTGNRGRLKHSIDLTLPPDPSFAYDPAERRLRTASKVAGSVITPIAIIVKGPLHELDVHVSGVGSVPTLTRGQNERLSTALLELAFERALGVVDAKNPLLQEALAKVVGNGADARSVAQTLAHEGRYGSAELFDPKNLEPAVVDLVQDLAEGFLMCLLLPAKSLGSRSLVKISYLWTAQGVGSGRQLLSSMHQFKLPMTAPSDAASYHLEFVVPEGVRCSALELPPSDHTTPKRSFVGFRDTVVHVHNGYDSAPRSDAQVELTSVRSPTHYQALGALGVTYVICWGLEFFADPEAVFKAGTNGLSLLLSFPALLFSLSAARHGSTLADALNRPFRWILLLCGAILFLLAAAPVVANSPAALADLWLLLANATSGLVVALGAQTVWAQCRLWWNFLRYEC